jgi:hypothetical protein
MRRYASRSGRRRSRVNVPILAVGVLMLLALLAHIAGGIRESMSIRPSLIAGTANGQPGLERLERNWAQAMCAFQLVTVDLLALTTVLFVLAFTEIIVQKKLVTSALAVFYFLWGSAWLIQLVALKSPRKNYLFLGHWAFWFICAGLLYWGAQSM